MLFQLMPRGLLDISRELRIEIGFKISHTFTGGIHLSLRKGNISTLNKQCSLSRQVFLN